MTILKDIPLGDKVEVYLNDNTKRIIESQNELTKGLSWISTLYATIVGKNIMIVCGIPATTDILLGWKPSDILPNNTNNPLFSISSYTNKGIASHVYIPKLLDYDIGLWVSPSTPVVGKFIPQKDTTAKKKYTNECPCGIHHSICEYHK